MDDKRADDGHDRDRLLTGPPFYLPEFEKSYRYIIDEYEVAPREIAIFMPCAVRKPYSASPSHQLIRSVISQVLSPEQYHLVIFGTCGIVPAELEEMYPYAHYHYMLGNAKTKKSSMIFSASRPHGWPGTSPRPGTSTNTASRIVSVFSGRRLSGDPKSPVYPFDLILPSRDMIDKVIEEGDCVFEEGSLSMDEYLGEFCDRLILFRNESLKRNNGKIAAGAR